MIHLQTHSKGKRLQPFAGERNQDHGPFAMLRFGISALQVNPVSQVSVKLVAQAGIGTVASGVAKANADVIQISGHDGGTGASPVSSIKHCGGPVEMGLADVHQVMAHPTTSPYRSYFIPRLLLGNSQCESCRNVLTSWCRLADVSLFI